VKDIKAYGMRSEVGEGVGWRKYPSVSELQGAPTKNRTDHISSRVKDIKAYGMTEGLGVIKYLLVSELQRAPTKKENSFEKFTCVRNDEPQLIRRTTKCGRRVVLVALLR
jgi:hypothetical protein